MVQPSGRAWHLSMGGLALSPLAPLGRLVLGLGLAGVRLAPLLLGLGLGLCLLGLFGLLGLLGLEAGPVLVADAVLVGVGALPLLFLAPGLVQRVIV